jgi:hypothetical protein
MFMAVQEVPDSLGTSDALLLGKRICAESRIVGRFDKDVHAVNELNAGSSPRSRRMLR